MRTIHPFTPADVDSMIDYFHSADAEFLRGMGADPAKLPPRAAWRERLLVDMQQPLAERQFYYLAWHLDGEPIGHSNINNITFGVEATMHLHLWRPLLRGGGHGTAFVTLCVADYFKQYALQTLWCEPYALNPGPNKTLPKIGFERVKTYTTTPGWLNFEQSVNRWRLTWDAWMATQVG